MTALAFFVGFATGAVVVVLGAVLAIQPREYEHWVAMRDKRRQDIANRLAGLL